jgi:hypothetical protein
MANSEWQTVQISDMSVLNLICRSFASFASFAVKDLVGK